VVYVRAQLCLGTHKRSEFSDILIRGVNELETYASVQLLYDVTARHDSKLHVVCVSMSLPAYGRLYTAASSYRWVHSNTRVCQS
jgi:hypothetical protein